MSTGPDEVGDGVVTMSKQTSRSLWLRNMSELDGLLLSSLVLCSIDAMFYTLFRTTVVPNLKGSIDHGSRMAPYRLNRLHMPSSRDSRSREGNIVVSITGYICLVRVGSKLTKPRARRIISRG
jgi:hypothetical protein